MQDLVLEAGRVRQPLDRRRDRRRSWQPATAERDAAGAAAVMKPASPPVSRAMTAARLPLELVDLDELRQDRGHRAHGLRHHDRGAERRHGARDVDDRPQAEFAADVGMASWGEVIGESARRGVNGA